VLGYQIARLRLRFGPALMQFQPGLTPTPDPQTEG
jgi:hypothetical protein